MRVVRRPDGALEYQVSTWREFTEDWRTAAPQYRGVAPDRRPAIYRPAQDGHEASYVAPHPMLWDLVKRRLADTHVPVKKREKHCQACKTPMAMARELYDLWVFRCPRCHGVEMFDKKEIGGVVGAGEREIAPKVSGADLA